MAIKSVKKLDVLINKLERELNNNNNKQKKLEVSTDERIRLEEEKLNNKLKPLKERNSVINKELKKYLNAKNKIIEYEKKQEEVLSSINLNNQMTNEEKEGDL